MVVKSRDATGNILVFSSLCVGLVALTLATFALDSVKWSVLATVAGGYSATGLLFQWALRRMAVPDSSLIVAPVQALVGLGLAFVLRARPDLVFYQLLWFILGIVAALLITAVYERLPLSRFQYLWGGLALLLMVITLLLGRRVGGARAWIVIGSLQFEPAEAVKVLVVLFLAGYLSQSRLALTEAQRSLGPLRIPEPRYVGPLVVVWALVLLLFVVQRDLGTAMLLYAVVIIMLQLVTGRIFFVSAGAFLAGIGAGLAYVGFFHVRVRFLAWVDPWSYINGAGFQVVQGLYALAAGGLFGVGWGHGRPERIPAVHTDYAFAALGEEIGLVGVLGVLLIYFLLVTAVIRAGLVLRDPFKKLLCTGIAVLIAVQTLIITGGVTRLIPVTGVTLPFVSYGGSSLTTLLASLGLVFGSLRAERRLQSE